MTACPVCRKARAMTSPVCRACQRKIAGICRSSAGPSAAVIGSLLRAKGCRSRDQLLMRHVKSHAGVYEALNAKLKAAQQATKAARKQRGRLEARLKRAEDAGKEYLAW